MPSTRQSRGTPTELPPSNTRNVSPFILPRFTWTLSVCSEVNSWHMAAIVSSETLIQS